MVGVLWDHGINSIVQDHMGGICTMEDKKMKYTIPEAEIVIFNNKDIITASDATDLINWELSGDGENL